MLHLISPPFISGLFRSEIYFQGRYFDTEWKQHVTTEAGKKVCEVIIEFSRDTQTGLTDVMVMADPKFEACLIVRAKQIREAKSCKY